MVPFSMCLRRNAEMRLADCCLTFTACEPFVLQARQQHLRSPRGRRKGLAIAAALQRLLPKGEKHTAADVNGRQLQARASGWSDVLFFRAHGLWMPRWALLFAPDIGRRATPGFTARHARSLHLRLLAPTHQPEAKVTREREMSRIAKQGVHRR